MTPGVDILQLIAGSTTLKKTANINGRGPEYKGPCPFCGGKDRLAVQPDKGQWWCRQCSPNEHWQSAADFVMKRDGVDFKTALHTLGVKEESREQTWDYHDAMGTVVYQVVRYVKGGEKGYFQRIPDGRGGWKNGLRGVPPTIYRLPEVVRASEMGDTIYITEGEKCADALRRLGLTATTNSGGAGKWRPEYSDFLEGAGDVVVLADNDPAGREHAESVLRSVRRHVPTARVVVFSELPPAGDVADWLALGHTKDDLLERTALAAVEVVEGDAVPADVRPALPVRLPTAPIDFHDLLALPREPIRWYAPGFFREGLGILAGEANIGKTPLVVQLAIAMACGVSWMNKVECRPAKVLFIGTEYTRSELAHVIESSAAGVKPPRGMLTFKCLDDGDEIQPATSTEALALLEYYLSVEKYEVIIIDVYTGFLPDEGFKQSVYRGDYKEFKPYHVLMLKYHALLLGTWHTVKRESNPRYMFNGSSGFWGVPASRVTLYTDQEGRTRLFSMPRFCPKTDWALAKEQTLAGQRWVVADAMPEPVMNDTERAIYRWLTANADKANPKSPATIAEMVGQQANSVRTVLGRMFDKNLVQRGMGNGYYVDVAPVADVADVARVADVALVKNGAQHGVAPLLRPDTASGRGENGAQQAQHDFQRNTAQHGATTNGHHHDVDQIGTLWRVWTPDRSEVVSFHKDEAEARAEAERLNGGAE